MARFRSRPMGLCSLPMRVGLAALAGSVLAVPMLAHSGHSLEMAQALEETTELDVETTQGLDAIPGAAAEASEAGQREVETVVPSLDGTDASEPIEIELAEPLEVDSGREADLGEADSDIAETDAENVETEAESQTAKAPALSLERPSEDPLLPKAVDGRALTPQEQQRLRLGLERLQREAEVAALQGDRSGSYRKFFRFLSLSQYLPVEEELVNLALVGRRTWRDNLGKEAQLIAARVKTIETEGGEKLLLSHRRELAEAYDSLGAWEKAITHYEGLLALQQPKGETTLGDDGLGAETSLGQTSPEPSSELNVGRLSAQPLEQLTLVRRLAQLSLFSFNYPSAAGYTEQALQLVPAVPPEQTRAGSPLGGFANPSSVFDAQLSDSDEPSGDELSQVDPLPSEIGPFPTSSSLLVQLAYVYEQDQRFAEAATTQQQIISLYSEPSLVYRQPALQVAIARNQTRSGQLVEAIASYEAAYRQAQSLQQFAVSDDALSQLAELYRNEGQLDDALAVYDILLQVNDLSFDLYGIADNQASRAEILLAQQQPEQARQAYLQAIYAAKLLGYREAEFQQQLDQLTIR